MSNEKTAEQMSADAFASWQQRKIEEQEQRAFIVRDLPNTLADIQERLRRVENMLNVSTPNEQQENDAPVQTNVELWHIRGLMDALDNLSLNVDSFDGFTAQEARDYAREYRATGAGDGDPQLRIFRAALMDLIVQMHCEQLDNTESPNKTDEK